MNAFVMDAFEFCRLKEYREGENPITDFPRLAAESLRKTDAIRWSAQGGADKMGHPQLTLVVAGTVELMCQRCLKPIEFAIESRSVLILAKDEASADQIEELVGEEIDVIVVPQPFSLAQLIEDEALLAIPLAPKHAVCADQVRQEVPEEGVVEKPASPFAVLKNWKQ
jgi:uncharacterized protein